nr:MAG TPA: hypothetical protein [Crassvirales sp.]
MEKRRWRGVCSPLILSNSFILLLILLFFLLKLFNSLHFSSNFPLSYSKSYC